MSRSLSSQERVRRSLPSRVEITYTLHLPDGTERHEKLPFVIGVIADLSGDVEEDRPDLRDPSRDFRHIHKDNFDKVLERAKPHLKYTVKNTLKGQNSADLLLVDLDIKSVDHFHPDQVVEQIPELRAERERRKRLVNLLNTLGSDPRLESQLQQIIDDPDKRAEFLARMAHREDGDATR